MNGRLVLCVGLGWAIVHIAWAVHARFIAVLDLLRGI